MILLDVFIIILLLRDNIILLVLPSNIQLIGAFDLLKDEAFSCVFLAENGLFDLARGVAGNGCKDDLARTLVPWKLKAEGIDFIFGHIFAFLDLDHRKSDLTESLFGDTDDGNVLDLCVRAEEIFDLNGINVLAARNDDILFEYRYTELRDLLLYFLGYAWREVFSKRGLLLQNRYIP